MLRYFGIFLYFYAPVLYLKPFDENHVQFSINVIGKKRRKNPKNRFEINGNCHKIVESFNLNGTKYLLPVEYTH